MYVCMYVSSLVRRHKVGLFGVVKRKKKEKVHHHNLRHNEIRTVQLLGKRNTNKTI